MYRRSPTETFDSQRRSGEICSLHEDLTGRIAPQAGLYYASIMKMMTVRLPESMASEIEAESRRRSISKSDVIRERLESARKKTSDDPLAGIADLIGSVDGLPSDMSARKKHYLRVLDYGRKRHR
jgi:hypothetical protein